LRNKSLEWNDYSIGIAIPLFGRDLFLGIAIPCEYYSLTKRNNIF
jgi:hypothetical protein